MKKSPDLLHRATYSFIVGIVMINLFIMLVFGNCLFWETVNANSARPAPQVFQWSKARQCGCNVMATYLSLK